MDRAPLLFRYDQLVLLEPNEVRALAQSEAGFADAFGTEVLKADFPGEDEPMTAGVTYWRFRSNLLLSTLHDSHTQVVYFDGSSNRWEAGPAMDNVPISV